MDKSFKKGFIKSSVTTSIGTIASMVFHFGSIMLLTRHLSKEDFGTYILIIVTSILFNLFAGLGLEITLTKFISSVKKENRGEILSTVLISRAVPLVVILIVYYLVGELIVRMIDERSADYFNLIPNKQKLFWIPDFQEHFLPEFFEKTDILIRKKNQQNLVDRKVNILFSSNSALNDFNHIYPNNQNNTGVIQFAVSSEKEYEEIDIEKLKEKYELPKDYFICSNQFWAHKNHFTILKALKILKKQGILCKVIFTGNTKDYR